MMASNGQAQYYKLVNQETDSDGEASQDRARVVPAKAPADGRTAWGGRRSAPGGKRLPHYGWTARAMLLFCLLIFALVLMAVLVLVALRPGLNNPRPTAAPTTIPAAKIVCTSSACVQLAGVIASMANFSADPCSNMWQYACGRLTDTLVLDEYVARWSWYGQAEKRTYQRIEQAFRTMNEQSSSDPASAASKAAELYKTCLDKNAVNQLGAVPLEEFFGELGGWNATTWPDSRTGITAALARVLELSPHDITDGDTLSPLLRLETGKDDKGNVSIFKIGQSGLGMSSKNLYTSNSSLSQSVTAAYRQFMGGVADVLGKDASSRLQLRSDLSRVYAFEVALAKISTPAADLRSPLAVYNKRTLTNISSLLPEIDWATLLKRVYPLSAGGVTMETEVIVESPAYLTRLSQLIQSTPKETLCNYVLWMVARTTAPLLSQPLADAYTVYKKALKGVPAAPRNVFCVTLVDKAMPLAVGRLFIDNVFKNSSITPATKLLTSILTAFKSNLPSVEWMDPETRAAAAEKVDAVLYQVGYSAAYSDATAIDTLYLQLNASTGSLFGDILSAWKLDRERVANMSIPGHVASRKGWDMRPTQANAFYEPLWNAIGIPGGILVRPFFDDQAPAAFNYGALGSVMGHELSHGFDDQGRQYDKDGNLRQWWSTNASEAFNKRATCVVQQYNNYTLFGQHLNGRLTLGENIADIGGVKLAYEAYREHVRQHGPHLPLPGLESVTGDQLYFLANSQYQCSKATRQELLRRLSVDVHSPLQWRGTGASITMPEFAAAFQCPVGSVMNPHQRCSIW